MAEETWQPQIPSSESVTDYRLPVIEALLPLDLPERVIVFRDRERVYRHIFRRITPDLWRAYFSRLSYEAERNLRRFDFRTSGLALYEEAILRVEGYRVPARDPSPEGPGAGSAPEAPAVGARRALGPEGGFGPQGEPPLSRHQEGRASPRRLAGSAACAPEVPPGGTARAAPRGESGDAMSLPNWKQLVPYPHRVKASELLMAVEEDKSEDCAAIELGTETAILTVLWTEDSEPGKMQKFSGLTHRLRTPSAEQERQYNKKMSEAVVVGGSRAGRTIYPAREDLLVKLYDELVESVEGYSLEGQPPRGLENIRREMDAFHKVAAAGKLFAPLTETEEEIT